MPRKSNAQIQIEREGNELRERLIRYLKNGGCYKVSDMELINLYSETHMFYKRLQHEMKSQKLLMKHTNKAGATNLIKNPLAVELTKTVQVLNNLLRSLGLTPAQRKAIQEYDYNPDKPEAERDEFDDFPD